MSRRNWLDERLYATSGSGTGLWAGIGDLKHGWRTSGYEPRVPPPDEHRPTLSLSTRHPLKARGSRRVVGISVGRLSVTAMVAILVFIADLSQGRAL